MEARDKDRVVQMFVGAPPEVHNGPITLVEYDPAWPELFRREARRVRSVLGDKALLIEHVGFDLGSGTAGQAHHRYPARRC